MLAWVAVLEAATSCAGQDDLWVDESGKVDSTSQLGPACVACRELFAGCNSGASDLQALDVCNQQFMACTAGNQLDATLCALPTPCDDCHTDFDACDRFGRDDCAAFFEDCLLDFEIGPYCALDGAGGGSGEDCYYRCGDADCHEDRECVICGDYCDDPACSGHPACA
jgi:hypothetical protein